jgi:hypothetical protein
MAFRRRKTAFSSSVMTFGFGCSGSSGSFEDVDD